MLHILHMEGSDEDLHGSVGSVGHEENGIVAHLTPTAEQVRLSFGLFRAAV